MTITLTREEAQQVLDALECCDDRIYALEDAAIETLRARLSAPEPPCKTGSQCIGGKCPQCVVSEPVAWMNEGDMGRTDWKVWAHGKPTATIPLYTAPPQREWQGLTDGEIKQIVGGWGSLPIDGYTRKLFDQIEAKLKEKNT